MLPTNIVFTSIGAKVTATSYLTSYPHSLFSLSHFLARMPRKVERPDAAEPELGQGPGRLEQDLQVLRQRRGPEENRRVGN